MLPAGCFVFSAHVLVYACVVYAYVGRSGVICGPLLGGAPLTAGLAHPWGFCAFALVAAVGAVAVAAIGPRTAVTRPAERRVDPA